MTVSEMDEAVRRFLATHITSLEQLELLLLLRTTEGREWSADECSRELRVDPRWVEERLAGLAASGFLVARAVQTTVKYRYAPLAEGTRALLDSAASSYKERRLSVINLIYGKLESDAVSFSEAFTIIKRKGG